MCEVVPGIVEWTKRGKKSDFRSIHTHNANQMFLVITKKPIIIIIPFFVQVSGFGLPSKLCFKCDGTVCNVCDAGTLSLSDTVSPFIFLLLAAIYSPCLSLPDYRPAAVHICCPLPWVMEEQRAGGTTEPNSCAAKMNSPGSEGKTFLSCSITSWSCSTVSCSCSISSPGTYTHKENVTTL